jgi:hypothetical protein
MSTSIGSGLNLMPVSLASSGDSIVIPGTPAGFLIRRILLASADLVTVQFKAGSRILSGPMPITYLGASFSNQAYYGADPGEDFIISLGAAVQTGGTIWYA